jgi:type II secretory pathway pseudopilin PulG
MVDRRHSTGFTYLTVLFAVAFAGVGLALLGEAWDTASRRERETELLYVGDQYRRAIERYYLNGAQRYPRTLQEMLKDPRSLETRRYLRQLYPDPLRGTPDWVLIRAPDGGIMGVHSRSQDKPLKLANFRLRDRDFEGAAKYSDWKFVYMPASQTAVKPVQAPAVGPAPAPPPKP